MGSDYSMGNNSLFEELPKGSISEIIMQRITDALISGQLKPGDKIPTEVEFSEKLGVSRNAGAAAASYGTKMTTVSSDFHYLSPAMGTEKLYGEAKAITARSDW